MMESYILRVYRTNPADGLVSGMVKDVESGQKRYFKNFNDLITVLAKTVGTGQLELSELSPPERVAMTG